MRRTRPQPAAAYRVADPARARRGSVDTRGIDARAGDSRSHQPPVMAALLRPGDMTAVPELPAVAATDRPARPSRCRARVAYGRRLSLSLYWPRTPQQAPMGAPPALAEAQVPHPERPDQYREVWHLRTRPSPRRPRADPSPDRPTVLACDVRQPKSPARSCAQRPEVPGKPGRLRLLTVGIGCDASQESAGWAGRPIPWTEL
jgi:hypothetical protein